MEIGYSIGLGVGIVVFYNHIGKRKITKDPTPIEVALRNYEEDVDKALILALIRQESAFKDNATSRAGARGIMQLMPNTAYHISGDKSVKKQKNKLSWRSGK